MLYVALFISAVLVLAAFVVNEKNAGMLLSGYRELDEAAKSAFPLKAYLRFMRSWMITLSVLFLAVSAYAEYYLPPSWQTAPVGLLMAGLSLFIWQGVRFSTVSKTLNKVAASILLLMGAGITFMGFYEEKESRMVIGPNEIRIESSFGISIAHEELAAWNLTDSLPKTRFKTYGFAVKGLYKGVFKTRDDRSVRLYVRANAGPYLYLRTRSGEEIWYGMQPEETRQMAQIIEGLQLPMVK